MTPAGILTSGVWTMGFNEGASSTGSRKRKIPINKTTLAAAINIQGFGPRRNTGPSCSRRAESRVQTCSRGFISREPQRFCNSFSKSMGAILL